MFWLRRKKLSVMSELTNSATILNTKTGADPGFLERGLICIKMCGVALLILSHVLKYPMNMN